MASTKRVVVTGIGAVSAAGVGAEKLWAAARDGRSCVRTPTYPHPYKGRIKIAAQVLDFDATAYLDKDVLPFCDPVSAYLLVAVDEAMAQAGFRGRRGSGRAAPPSSAPASVALRRSRRASTRPCSAPASRNP